MTRKDFSDEELTAFLDGESDAQLTAQIAAAADQNVELQARLAALELPLEPIHRSFDALLKAAPAMNALPEPAASQNGVSMPKALGGMAASLVVGALISFWALAGGKQLEWRDYAAAYHVLYVNGTLADFNTTQAEMDAALLHLGTVVGRDLTAAPLDTVLEYKRGQVLGYQGQPLIQLAYLSPLGDPVALCLIRTEGADMDVEMTALEGLAAAKWQRDGVAYLLIGGTDTGLIKEAAARFSDAL